MKTHVLRLPRARPFALALLLAALVAPAGRASPEPGTTITVVTLNLWHDQRDWPKRLAVMLPVLREIRPDALCLQEVLQHETLENQAKTLADSLGYAFHFTSVDSAHHAKRYGNAILTPHPVLKAGGKNLLPLDDYRTVAHVRIDVNGTPVDVYDTHLHHTPEGGAIRAAQIRDLLAFVDATRGGGPVVLAGDFNAELGVLEMAGLERGYEDVFRSVHPDATPAEAGTYGPPVGFPPRAIDHVFVLREGRGRLAPVSCEILFATPGADSVWASDHFGVKAVLRIHGE